MAFPPCKPSSILLNFPVSGCKNPRQSPVLWVTSHHLLSGGTRLRIRACLAGCGNEPLRPSQCSCHGRRSSLLIADDPLLLKEKVSRAPRRSLRNTPHPTSPRNIPGETSPYPETILGHSQSSGETTEHFPESCLDKKNSETPLRNEGVHLGFLFLWKQPPHTTDPSGCGLRYTHPMGCLVGCFPSSLISSPRGPQQAQNRGKDPHLFSLGALFHPY